MSAAAAKALMSNAMAHPLVSPHATLSDDAFTLFALPKQFRLNQAALDAAWHTINKELHPDRFVNHSDTEKRIALMWATKVNEAYLTLKTPLARARYLLSLQGIDTEEESNTSMPTSFLTEQLEWREHIEQAQTNQAQLEQLDTLLHAEEDTLLTQLECALDQEKDPQSAVLLLRKLSFFSKLLEQIKTSLS